MEMLGNGGEGRFDVKDGEKKGIWLKAEWGEGNEGDLAAKTRLRRRGCGGKET